ncbi:MAG: hypothetical protein NXH97_12590 [Rhodobacteraceae bacterium]|nr:hypothetical protein [Paracoccaceae bacterium]
MQDPQVLLLNALAGENDMIAALTDDYGNKAVLFDGMEQGGYHFIDKTPSATNLTNYTFKQIHQTAVLPSYELLHDEKLATQDLDYDVAKANEYLDKAFPEKDGDGFRLSPDGNRIQFALSSRADKALVACISQMLVGYWRDVGVDTRFDVVDRSLARFHKNANQHFAIIEYFPGGARDAFLLPTPWGPMLHNAVYGILWFHCYRAEGGEEPPENLMRQIELWNTINATADQEARAEKMCEILANAAEGFYDIRIAVPPVELWHRKRQDAQRSR